LGRPASAATRLPSLTGLRFLAAFLVFGFHVNASHLFGHAGVQRGVGYVFGEGAVGVSFFFILSGFVLTWSARAGDTARAFWRRRAAKIYPNHVTTALVALGAVVVFGGALSVAAVVTNLALLQAWVPRESVFFGLNTPSWSLSCELFFYLCFPLLLHLINRMGTRLLWPATVAGLALVWLMPVGAMALPAGLRYWFVYVFPPVRMIEFVIGILLARIVRSGRWIRLGAAPAAVLAVAGYLVAAHLPGAFSYIAGTVVPLALLIPAVASTDVRGTLSVLRSRTMVFLGEVSFAFYLVHQLAIRLVAKALGSHPWATPAAVAIALAMLAVSLAGAWLLWRIVERPAMARFAPRRRRVPAVAAPPAVAEPEPSPAS
jgi:peptidoglycan/LPS O-acetylase OafA/YrhL